ncbi:MAG: glycosyltransferase family 4 protein [Sulfitobacter sp.]
MPSRLSSYLNLIAKSRFNRRHIQALEAKLTPDTAVTIYALCWHTMLAAVFYKAPQKQAAWAPFYPRARVTRSGVEIGRFTPRASRLLGRLWRLSLPKSTRILTSKRINGLPRPNNMISLGFRKKATLFVKDPAEGVGRLHLNDAPTEGDAGHHTKQDATADSREAVFLLHDYFIKGDARLPFIAAQARRYAKAYILVTRADTNLTALHAALSREGCEATVITFAELIGPEGADVRTTPRLRRVYKRVIVRPVRAVWRGVTYPFKRGIRFVRQWPVHYRTTISRLPNTVARGLPGPTVDLEEHMLKWSENVGLLMAGAPVDLVHSHDVISAPAGADLVRSTGAFHVVDVNEFPMLSQRVGRLFKRMNTAMRERIEGQIRAALQAADCNVAVSLGVARITGRFYGARTLAVRNFRDYELFSESSMREDWNIPGGDVVLVHACTISPDYKSDLLVEVLAKLPAHYHLVLVGGTVSQAYQDKLVRRAQYLGAGARLHIKGEINNPHDYLSYVAGAELGVVLMTPEVPLIRFGLANRHADLIAAGLPMVSTYTIESSRILRMTGNGESVHSLDPATLAAAIVALRENPESWAKARERAAHARYEFTWEKEIQRYPNPIADQIVRDEPNAGTDDSSDTAPPKPIAALLFQRGLIRNKRILRLGLMLQARGYRVLYLARAMPNKTVIAGQPDALFLRVPAVNTFNPHLLKTTRARLHRWIDKAGHSVEATSPDA